MRANVTWQIREKDSFILLLMTSRYEIYCEMWFLYRHNLSHILSNTASASAKTLTHTQRLKWCYHMLVIQTHGLQWCLRQSFSLNEPYHLFEIQIPSWVPPPHTHLFHSSFSTSFLFIFYDKNKIYFYQIHLYFLQLLVKGSDG